MKVQSSVSFTPAMNNVLGWLKSISTVLTNNVSFGHTLENTDENTNMDGFKVSGVTPGTANTLFSIAHKLNRIPIGFLTLSVNRPGAVLHRSGAWTKTQIQLECNVATVAYAIFIV